MKQYNLKQYILGITVLVLLCCQQQVQALPFEPVAAESLPTELTVRNLFSWGHKLWGLAQSLRGAQYIDSSSEDLRKQGAGFIQSAQNEFGLSRSWAGYHSSFPPINWALSFDLRNPWHWSGLVVGTGLTVWLTSLAIKKYKQSRTPPPAAPAAPAQP